jgi:hypothetical protein
MGRKGKNGEKYRNTESGKKGQEWGEVHILRAGRKERRGEVQILRVESKERRGDVQILRVGESREKCR